MGKHMHAEGIFREAYLHKADVSRLTRCATERDFLPILSWLSMHRIGAVLVTPTIFIAVLSRVFTAGLPPHHKEEHVEVLYPANNGLEIYVR